VPVYMVERHLPGITVKQLAALQVAATASSAAFTALGKPIRYIRCLFVPGESRCTCRFEAPTADLAREVNDEAQLPYTRILSAMDFSP
jgi:Protein of unknown function (DUF4242)